MKNHVSFFCAHLSPFRVHSAKIHTVVQVLNPGIVLDCHSFIHLLFLIKHHTLLNNPCLPHCPSHQGSSYMNSWFTVCVTALDSYIVCFPQVSAHWPLLPVLFQTCLRSFLNVRAEESFSCLNPLLGSESFQVVKFSLISGIYMALHDLAFPFLLTFPKYHILRL